jgi:hypothetical protein
MADVLAPGVAAGGAGAAVSAAAPLPAPAAVHVPIPGAVPVPGGYVLNGHRVRDQRNAPVRKLTTGLLGTYKLINARYYQAKKERQTKAAGGPAANVDYVVTVGTMLGDHYRVVEAMGKGSFGQVVSAEDTRTHVKVAVKVIKNREAFRRQARTEIRLLEVLNRKDPDDQWCIGE